MEPVNSGLHEVFQGVLQQLDAVEREIDAARHRLSLARDGLREHLLVLADPENPHRQRHVEGAIVALQSEDIAGQMLDHARYRVNVLLAVGHGLAPGRVPPGGLDDELASAARALAALARCRRPVALAPVVVGDLEFF
ncbi:MAG: hypothetical protein J0H69_01845 [Burkholderiales bacterium]|nr:hypothetical protein [Burkholderiales bacterium]